MTDETDLIDGFLEDAGAAVASNAISKAKSLYQGVLRLDESNLEALTQLAAISLAENNPQTALSYFTIAVEQHSKEADVHHGLSVAYRELGHADRAEQALETALRIEPEHEPALFDKAVLLQKQGNLHKADEIYLKIASRDERRIDAIFNRGVVMFRKGNLKAAERWFRQAAKLDPNAPQPLVNLALVYRCKGYLDAADRCLRHVIEHHPDFVDAQWNLANLELLQGNLKDGFARSEWRFKRSGFNPPVRSIPRWQGETLTDKKLLLVAEQGLGDTIQMVRYAKNIAEAGGLVGVEVQESLAELMSTMFGVAQVLKLGQDSSGYDYWLPIMSLPAVLNTTLDTIPHESSYLSVPPGSQSFSLPTDGFKVGIVWRGNPKHELDQYRSIALNKWVPILEVKGVQFISLQVGLDGKEIASVPEAQDVHDASALLTDFSATAALVSELDLIISVDTAVAHLAGALGKPIWLIISSANDWRWLTDRADSPWYPTMRIFRGSTLKVWDDTMSKVAAALSDRVSTLSKGDSDLNE